MARNTLMNMEQFFDYVRDNIKNYLGSEYAACDVDIREVTKENDTLLHGLTIAVPGDSIVPVIYLDPMFRKYETGAELDTIMRDIREIRVRNNGTEIMQFVSTFTDFEQVKNNIHVKICDPELNSVRLENCVSKSYGDYTATYYVALAEQGSITVTHQLAETWGVSPDTIDAVAKANDLRDGPVLASLDTLVNTMVYGDNTTENLYNSPEQLDLEQYFTPMLCLTNNSKVYGAALCINDVVQEQIGRLIGDDYYIIPSSLHEVLIIPEKCDISVSEMTDMVREVNTKEVADTDILSYKVQHYSVHARVMENAAVYVDRVAENPEFYGKTAEAPAIQQSLPSDPII